ncbi:hypothetical protein HZ326_21409 [Fusarium oxysporum f. sp. albedinis]|nr:hypothetical protein HZ326_21409 [Fusarium oxysporum f. sp. albedinis]
MHENKGPVMKDKPLNTNGRYLDLLRTERSGSVAFVTSNNHLSSSPAPNVSFTATSCRIVVIVNPTFFMTFFTIFFKIFFTAFLHSSLHPGQS